MDAKEEQPTTPPPQSSSLSRQITIYTYPKVKRRKSQSVKTKQTQIHDESPEPSLSTELVLYDKVGKSTSSKQKRAVVNDFYDKTEAKSSTMERAEEIKASLDASFPSFAKALVRSNVTVGFWMHLPMKFCKLHLPKYDAAVNVETEDGEEHVINFISDRTALSGGWKAFCSTNKLHEGDVLIFHLVKPLRFKVYIVRGSKENSKIGKADATEKQNNSAEEDLESHKKFKTSDLSTESPLHEKTEEKSLIIMNEVHETNQSDIDTDDLGSKPLEIITSSESLPNFKDVESMECFSVLVNGLPIDSELSDHHRTKYYELCCSQNSFLHENLLKSINYKLAAEIIIGTVNISEAVRASRLDSSLADFAVWDKTLKGFELLGMNVGFLRSRLGRLMNLARESEEAIESGCRELRLEQAWLVEEMTSLKLKLAELKEVREQLDAEVKALKGDAEKQERIFQEAVEASW